jgi:hypothetical protein
VRVSYKKGVANHLDPKLCGETVRPSRSVSRGCAGRVNEPRKQRSQMPTPLLQAEGNNGRIVIARAGRTGAVEERGHAHKQLHAREPRDLVVAGRNREPAARGRPRPESRDERPREVTCAHSTDEAPEQSRESGGGRGGGKGCNQGESDWAKRTPDAEPGKCAKCA